MFADIPLPLDWPVYVAFEQAQAYTAWKGAVLLTEAQFHRAAYPADEKGPGDLTRENVDFRSWDPVPVNATEANGFGVSQMIGNGWEWTATRFEPFPGFEPFPWYPGYSANFFDGEHYVLKGGSPRTAARLLRSSFRNWFRPAYPYLYATFRLVEN
jgi:formylglycine-generating enzyme required for sulfatase activity